MSPASDLLLHPVTVDAHVTPEKIRYHGKLLAAVIQSGVRH